MAYLYLTEQGAVLKKSGQRLIVEKDGEKLLDTPASKIEGVLIFGNVQFTTQAVQLLFQQGVELGIFSQNGRLLGQLTSTFNKNIDLRQAQYARKSEGPFSLSIAKTIVQAKMANGLEFLRQFMHNHPETDLKESCEHLAKLIREIEDQSALDSLLGLEGFGAKQYFQAFGKMVRHSFNFAGRRKRPPPDPVNALLSLGYTLVYNEIGSLLDGMGFDPYLGYLHQPRYGHATLASDLLEEFRVPLVDRFTLRLINNQVFKEQNFYLHQPSGGVYLIDDSRKAYFAEYEEYISQPVGCAEDEKETSFRKLFRRQSERLRDSIISGNPYLPFRFKW